MDIGFHTAGNRQGPGDSAASLSPAQAPCHLFSQALLLPKGSVTSFRYGAESPGLRGTHVEHEGSSDRPLMLSAWLEKGCFLEVIPCRPHCTDTLRLLLAHHRAERVTHVLLIIRRIMCCRPHHSALSRGAGYQPGRQEKLWPAPQQS